MGFKTLLFTLAFASASQLSAASCFDTAAVPCAAAMDIQAAPEPAPARAAGKPVVITIVGVDFAEVGFGKLELAYFKDILGHLIGMHSLDVSLFERKMEAVRADIAGNDAYGKLPDNYLDARLAAVLPPGKYDIAPIRWSRDPDESAAAVPLVEAEIRRIVKAAKAEGRPVYLVAHSWGTILAHTALHRLAKSAPEVKIDKLITLGSPLVPGHWWLEIFLKYQIKEGQLQSYVAKPANVALWLNLWAYNDFFSNRIAAADRNMLVDGDTRELEAQVKRAAELNHSLRPEALRDLFFLKSIKGWHFAYIMDFQVFLKTLKKGYELSLLGPIVAQELS